MCLQECWTRISCCFPRPPASALSLLGSRPAALGGGEDGLPPAGIAAGARSVSQQPLPLCHPTSTQQFVLQQEVQAAERREGRLAWGSLSRQNPRPISCCVYPLPRGSCGLEA